MNIKILSINISQFKGITSLELNDLQDTVNINGTNKTGKTTLANSFLWCLFGKDTEGRTNFEIMPLDEFNNVIPHLQPSVEIKLDIDGNHRRFKRALKQDWVKKRGSLEKTFDGSTTTDYFIDDVPVKLKEYKEVIESYIDEQVLRSITLPSFFPSLEWKKKRDIITAISGDIDVSEIQGREEFKSLFAKLEGRSIIDYKKVIALEKRGYKDELKSIPEGIKATQQFIPETIPDWALLSGQISEKESEIKAIDLKIADKSKVLTEHQDLISKRSDEAVKQRVLQGQFVSEYTAENRKKKEALNTLLGEKKDLLSTHNTKLSNTKRQIRVLNEDNESLNRDISSLSDKRSENKNKYLKLKNTAHTEPTDSNCNTCGQAVIISEDKRNEMRDNWNNEKAEKLKAILDINNPLIESSEKKVSLIEKNNKDINDIQKQIEIIKADITEANKKINTLESQYNAFDLSASEQEAKKQSFYLDTQAKIDELCKLPEIPVVDVSEYNEQKANINSQVDILKDQLSKRSQIEQAKTQIEKYKNRGGELSQKIADLEGLEFQAEEYEKAEITELETLVNSKFENVQFKMFEQHNNGGYSPTCVILINGVPYESANNAARVNAGISIINQLSKFYDVTAPIFVDNRESVVELQETESQVFNLIVNKEYKSLNIS